MPSTLPPVKAGTSPLPRRRRLPRRRSSASTTSIPASRQVDPFSCRRAAGPMEDDMTKLGFQLYSARNFPPLADTLKALGKAGYAQVEGYGALYASMDESQLKAMRADLDANGLTMPTAHLGLDLLESEP